MQPNQNQWITVGLWLLELSLHTSTISKGNQQTTVEFYAKHSSGEDEDISKTNGAAP
jgi:hypothetical protein